jgi:Myosin N-terminal SH3-like domain.
MIYEEQASDIIGCFCTLLNPYKGYTDGEIVGDYGNDIVVRLTNGKEVVEHRDDVIIYKD